MSSGSSQLLLNFGDLPSPQIPRATASTNLFFAVVPPACVAANIRQRAEMLQRSQRLHGTLRPEAVLHITLNGIGAFTDVPQRVARGAMQAGARVALAPFEISLERAMSFSGYRQRPYVLTVGRGREELTALQRAIGIAMRGVGFRWRDSGYFTPHATVLYGPEAAPAIELPEPITWVVRDFVLVRSLVGKTQHVHCARWPLHPH